MRVYTSLRCCFVRYGVPVEPPRGARGTRWPPAPRRGERRIRSSFPRPPVIVNRLSSRLVVMTGAQSGSRFIFFWRRVRAAYQADRRPTTASKSFPRVLYDCGRVCGALAKHLECPQIRTQHRSSTGPKISPGAQKKPLNLLPPRQHGVPDRPDPRQVCGADPESGAHLSHMQPKQSASSTDWRQTTPTWSRLSPFMPISLARPDQGSQRSPRGIDA